jgi:Ca2+-binding RTX toxin-like protein
MCIVCRFSGINFHKPQNNKIEEVDAAANSDSLYSLSSGESFSGILNNNDKDWIEIDLTEGQKYSFQLKSLDEDNQLSSTSIQIYDLEENLLTYDNLSERTFTADYSGSFFLSAENNQDSSDEISYMISARKLPKRDFGSYSPREVKTSNTWSEIDKSNPYIEGLMVGDGVKWGNKKSTSQTKLKYYIYDDENINDYYAGEVFDEEEASFISAMGAYSSVANISFSEGSSDKTSHILWAVLNDGDSGSALGWAINPNTGSNKNYSGITTQNWEEYSSSTELDDPDILLPGSYYYITTIHELGHSLGLSHPHDDDNVFPGVDDSSDTGKNGLNAHPYTVMTYNDMDANKYLPDDRAYSGFLETLGAFDIAAIQYLYGPNKSQNTGDTTYELTQSELNGWNCIWDNGGTDTISAESALKAVNIDLRNATLKKETGGGGFVSQIDDLSRGYTIAYNSTGDCIIENATGSGNDDVIRGNSGKNTINGKSGNDEINGGGGNDKLYGAGGNDSIYGDSGKDYIKGHSGKDTVFGGSGADTILGGSGNDKLYGGSSSDTINGESGDDYLKGHSGNDTINGDEGDDRILGGTGKDKLYGASGKDLIYGEEGDDYIKGHSSNDTLYGGEDDDEIKGGSGNDKIYGGQDDDELYGEEGDDYIKGHSGKDYIHGGEGDDEIKGGSGKDKIYGASGKDLIYGEDGNDYLWGNSKDDTIYGGEGDDTIVGGSNDDNLYGGKDNDVIYGSTGEDYIKGHSGIDELYGGSGNDIIKGGSGGDEIYGGKGVDSIFGESGRDEFYLTTGSGYDKIRDFEKGEDKIYIRDIDDLRVVDSGKHSRIYDDDDLLAIIYNEDDLSVSGSFLI